MMLFFVFAAALLVSVLLSELAHRTVVSMAVVFLLVGFFAGGVTDVLSLQPGDPIVVYLAELALFSVLFTDGMRVGVRDLASAWHLPGRALLFGLPLTLLFTALLAHYVAGLPWIYAFLIGAVLSPTDPVFASAIVGSERVPERLRRLLNVESGINDGLVLPAVVILLAVASSGSVEPLKLLGELGLGIALGVGIPWIALRLESSRFFAAASGYEPLYALSIGIFVLAAALVTHANLFLAAFSAGVTLATVSPRFKEAFHEFGELLAELLKLAAILVFGALISLSFLGEIELSGYVFALLALVLVRPLALLISLAGSRIGWRIWGAAAWFGPKGFASVVYGLLVLESGAARSDEVFHLVALVIAASILAHSSTDVFVASQFQEPEE
ncbi:cation:proton antiporter [soil metagenome]